MKPTNVLVLCGGQSAEHEVSLKSAANVIAVIDKTTYAVTKLVLPKDGDISELLRVLQTGTSEVVFPILHGPNGEDGTIQGLCQLAGVPCVGAGVLGSAIGMDKDVMKRLLREAGIPVADFRSVRSPDELSYEAASAELGSTLFVKPANMGSSVGVHKVHNEAEYNNALTDAFSFDSKVLIEELVVGREVECAVLGNTEPKASVVGEIIPQHEFYSYEAKYLDAEGATLAIPADLPSAVVSKIQQLAVQVFTTLECRGLGRVDFFVTPEYEFKVIEINTIPGFTNISMYPSLWAASGVTYAELIHELLQLAMTHHTQQTAHTSVTSGF